MPTAHLGSNLIPDLPGMVKESNQGAQGGVNCRLPNGWVVTVRSCEVEPNFLTTLLNVDFNKYFLVFTGFRGNVRRITDIMPVEDNRPNDDKLFLSPVELRALLERVAGFDSSGHFPKRQS